MLNDVTVKIILVFRHFAAQSACPESPVTHPIDKRKIPLVILNLSIDITVSDYDLDRGLTDSQDTQKHSTVSIVDDDTEGPEVQLSTQGFELSPDGLTALITLTAEDPSGIDSNGVQVLLNGELVANSLGVYTLTIEEAGDNTVTATVFDDDHDRGSIDRSVTSSILLLDVSIALVFYEIPKLVKELSKTIQESSNQDWAKPQSSWTNAVPSKIQALDSLIRTGEYQESIDKIQGDLLPKLTGLRINEKPHPNPWLVNADLLRITNRLRPPSKQPRRRRSPIPSSD